MPEENKPAEKQDHDLEQILEAFDQIKDTFHFPRTLSYEHDDVTVKYWNSMLGLAEEKGTQRESIVSSFCQRFDANQEQMKDLLSNNHNWIDYNLYHAFSAHCQQQLGMDTETFWQGVADKTFLDYSDKQIAVGRFFPLDFIIKQMSGQFKNWSKVNEIQVEKLDRSKNSYKIKRKTGEKTQKKTEQLIGKEALDILLKRDCIFTDYSFTTTFQKLFNQPNLYLETGQSEADGNEWSEYFVHPSSPHRFKIVEKYYSFIASLKNFGRSHKGNLKKENEEFKQIIFEYEQTISARTRDLELANAKIERRQETIMDLLSDISEIRMTGDRHTIRGTLDNAWVKEKNETREIISEQIFFAYNHFKNNSEIYQFLKESCQPFGINEEDFDNKETILNKLGKIIFDEKTEENNNQIIKEEENNLLDLLDDFIKEDIYLNSAYEQFEKIKKQYKTILDKNNFNEFNPFRLLVTLKSTKEKMDSINQKISKMGQVGFLDQVKLSDAANEGIQQAKKEKGSEIGITLELDYDPLISTNKDALVYMVKDIISNMIDHGKATKGTIVSKLPSEIDNKRLPNYTRFVFKTHPMLYLGFKDNGISISTEKAEEINQYLSSGLGNTEDISSRKEAENISGGLGTKNLQKISKLHDIRIHYQPSNEGTTIDCYFGRLDI
ncbi:hypothetical protein HOL59_04470 [Candidatus Woesearchaeota archaeon]|jgi:signal transduction histidine kinase|nr:hypothetical protein [Candidatus Woesearchaeota archaeon]